MNIYRGECPRENRREEYGPTCAALRRAGRLCAAARRRDGMEGGGADNCDGEYSLKLANAESVLPE